MIVRIEIYGTNSSNWARKVTQEREKVCQEAKKMKWTGNTRAHCGDLRNQRRGYKKKRGTES
jgi:hypothetical protein